MDLLYKLIELKIKEFYYSFITNFIINVLCVRLQKIVVYIVVTLSHINSSLRFPFSPNLAVRKSTNPHRCFIGDTDFYYEHHVPRDTHIHALAIWDINSSVYCLLLHYYAVDAWISYQSSVSTKRYRTPAFEKVQLKTSPTQNNHIYIYMLRAIYLPYNWFTYTKLPCVSPKLELLIIAWICEWKIYISKGLTTTSPTRGVIPWSLLRKVKVIDLLNV